MKALTNRFFLTILLVAFSTVAFSQSTPTNEKSSFVSEAQAQEMIQTNTVEMSSVEISNWFAGAKQETNVTSVKESTTINRSSLISKKEQYLKSGFSTKTILIRSIMKKADGYVNATV
jgi:hypothetical protein